MLATADVGNYGLANFHRTRNTEPRKSGIVSRSKASARSEERSGV